jgi:hypothetical protein
MYKISGGAITVELTTAIKAIISTGVLHNICEHRGIPLPTDENVIATEDEGSDDSGASVCTGNGQDVAEGEAVRARLIRAHFA